MLKLRARRLGFNRLLIWLILLSLGMGWGVYGRVTAHAGNSWWRPFSTSLMRKAGSPVSPVRTRMATLTVTNGDDAGAGSLRDTIANATANDTIVFQSGVTTVTLTSASLTVDKALTIDGGTSGVTITRSSASSFRIFLVTDDLTLNKLTVTNGDSSPGTNSAASGGAIRVTGGSLTLTACTFSGNNSSNSGGAVDMASTAGALTVSDCSFTSNTCGNSGAAMSIASPGPNSISTSTFNLNTATGSSGALNLNTATTVTNCTVTGNSSTGTGGAITANATSTFTNVTIVNNSTSLVHANAAGGVRTGTSTFTYTFNNCLIAGNTTGNNTVQLSNTTSGQTTSVMTGSNNVIGDNTSIINSPNLANGVNNNLIGTSASPLSPLVDALASNGGPTQTMALQSNSPAINRATSGAPTTDQRGYNRPNTADAGAFEFGGTAPVTNAPEIVVTETGVGNINDNTSFSFGTTTVGTPVTKTFTVTNNGTANLTLSNLSVPSGFSIATNFGSTTIAGSGGTTTFQITMAAAAPSTPSGTLTFDNNDTDENPFNFTISGTVNKNNTTTTINNAVALGTPTVVGQAYSVEASVSSGGGTPTGTITISDSSQTCTITLPATSCNLTSITQGAKSITATYNGDSNFNTSTSTGASHTVNKAQTTANITNIAPEPSVFGQSYAVTANVTIFGAGGGTPTGTITVSEGPNSCTITLSSGSGTCNLPSNSVGLKNLFAHYNGDANYFNSPTSGSISHRINKAGVNVTITSDNPDSSAVGQNVTVAFTVAAAAPGAGTPSGTVTLTVSGGSETCTGALVSGSGSCTLSLIAPGNRTFTATYNGDSNFNTGTDTEAHMVVAPPVIAKSFLPSTTPVNGVSTLTITITNPVANTVALTGVGFTDTFPSGLVVAATPNLTNTCGGTLTNLANGAVSAGDNSLKLSGGTVGTTPPRTCSISVNVTPTAPGPLDNTINSVSSTEGGSNNTPATATLLTNTPPTISSNNVSVAAGSSAASFTIATAADTDQAADTLGITINGNPTTASSNGVTVSGMAIQANGSVTANIATTCAATTATFNLVVTDNQNATGSGTLTVTVTPNTPPVLSYDPVNIIAATNPMFAPATAPSDNGTFTIGSVSVSPNNGGLGVLPNQSNGVVTILSAFQVGTYTVMVPITDNCGATNTGQLSVTVGCPTINFNQTSLPAAIINTAYPQVLSASPAGGDYSFAVTSGLLPAGLTLNQNGSFSGAPTQAGTSNFRVTVTGFAGTGGSCPAFQDYTLTVVAPPVIAKSFSPSTTPVNGTSTLTITITNPANNTVTLTGLGFTDTFPAGLVIAATPNLTNSCSGTLTNLTNGAVSAGDNGLKLSGGTIGTAPPRTCAISVNVTPTVQGPLVNTINSVSSTEGGSNTTPATATLLTNLPPVVTVVPVTRAAGSITSTLLLAHVSDDMTPVTALTATVNNAASATVNGVTISGLTINAGGQLQGQVLAACNATDASFTLNVTDSANATTNVTLNVTVPANPGPMLSYAAPPALSAGQTLNVAPATGPSDNGNVASSVVLGVTPAFGGTVAVNPVSGLVTVSNATPIGSYNVIIRATDQCGVFTDAAFTFNVTCPTITLNPGSLPGGQAGVAYSQTLTASPAGGGYSFGVTGGSLPNGLTLAANGALTGTPTTPGTFNFTVTATGFGTCTASQSYTVAITCPTVSLTSLAGGTAGVAYHQSVSASPAGGNYSFAVTGGSLPPGLTLAANGALTGTPTTGGTFNFTVTATGFGTCTGSQSYSLVIACPTLSLSPASLPNGTGGTAYSANLSATPNGTTYSFAITSGTLPPGLTLASGGALSGTPAQAGTFTFTVTATGFGTCTGTQVYTLTITCPTITLSAPPLPNGTVGTAYNQSVTAQPSGPTYSYALTSGTLPTSVSLNAATGALTGTPTTGGTYTFTVTATGFNSCTGSQSYTLTVACPTITVNPASLPGGTAGVAYSQALTVTPTGTYSFSLTAGNLPPGLSLNTTTGALTGTPTATGTYNFTVKAAAGSCFGTRAYTLVVSCPTITLTPASLPGGSLGTAYSQTLTATPSGNYTFTRTGGTLPPGLNLNTAGALTGTPTAAGTYTFTVRAQGFGTCPGTRSYTVTVTASCPTITLPASLPNGTLGLNYYGDLGGTTPSGNYSYTLTSGALPPGLTLDNLFGALLGTPTATGTFNFTLQARTSAGCSGTRAFTVVIGSAGAAALAQFADYDGDGQADPVLWRAASGTWDMLTSAQARQVATAWGAAGDVTLLGDYDGDGKSDLAVFRPGNGTWYIQRSRDGSALVKQWGTATDVPVPGDYDGDGVTDLAVWRGASGTWYIQRSRDQQAEVSVWGTSAAPYLDVPVPGDYDGDGQTDRAVFRRQTGTWLLQRSRDGQVVVQAWGLGTDTPVAADYDGDGQTDLAVWRGTTGEWFVLTSTEPGYQRTTWGTASLGDIPVAADYDGDGRADLAVWRASTGQWYCQLSHDQATRMSLHGQRGDVPVGRRAQP